MVHSLSIVPATAEHIDPVADEIRATDRDEILASSGRTPRQSIECALSMSVGAWTVLFDDVPAGIFGVGDLHALLGTVSDIKIGVPWFLGTDAVDANRAAFLRASVEWRDRFLREYSVLTNLVDDRNASSKRWLRWLGFTLGEPVNVGHQGLPFRPFELRRGSAETASVIQHGMS